MQDSHNSFPTRTLYGDIITTLDRELKMSVVKIFSGIPDDGFGNGMEKMGVVKSLLWELERKCWSECVDDFPLYKIPLPPRASIIIK